MKQTYIFLFLLATASGFAQRFDILSGKLENLKGIKEYNTTFDYTGMTVHGFETEEEFLSEKMHKRENRPGAAEKFKEAWFANRESMYEPAFISYFNKMFKDGEIKVAKKPEAKYTMQVKSTWIYPGYNAGPDVVPAKISAIVTVYETADPKKIILIMEFDKAIGVKHSVMTNTLGDRISWAYEKIAKNLSMQMKRFL